MKRYVLSWIMGPALLLAAACGDRMNNGDDTADTSMTTMPVVTPAPEDNMPEQRDTAAVPRIDPTLDSAAKEKDETLPPK